MIIILGVSGGIGDYLAREFVSEGEIVYGTYNSSSNMKTQGGRYSKVDVRDYTLVSNFINGIPDKNNMVLINCASIIYNKFAHKSESNKWADVINVNLIGAFNAIRAVLPFMRDDNYGRIINLSSVVAQMGVAGTSAYAASKSGLWGMAKSIAKENGDKDITINNINLGYFNIGMGVALSEDIKNTVINSIPMKKFGDKEEVHKTIKFLIDARYMTGTSIDINGGLC